MLRIDAHQHFWRFSPENYSWIQASMVQLRRDFSPEDLELELAAAGIAGTVLVEARGHLEETDNLLAIAERTPFVRGVVGWLPLTDPNIEGWIEKYTARRALRGVRHWLGPHTDTDYMFDSALQRGLRALLASGLTFDLMLWPSQLHNVSALVDRHPEQVFVLDHFAKPYIREGRLEPWRKELFELARRPNVYCKVSGLATEADPKQWSPRDLQQYLDAALEAFTPRRLMFGSDWPVCTLASSYRRWVETVGAWTRALSVAEQERIWSGTALEAYDL